MLGIFVKDLYTVRKQAVWYAAVVVVFAALSVLIKQVAYAAAIGILVPVSMPLTAIAYEEREGSQKFVVASGIPRAAIVGEKYLLGLLFWLWSAAAYTTAYFILGAEGGAVEFVLPLCLPLVVLSAVLPLAAKFGVEKARAYMIAVIVVSGGYLMLTTLFGLTVFSEAILEVPGNIVQSAVGAVLGLVLYSGVRKAYRQLDDLRW